MNPWILLLIAILAEITATTALKATQGFTVLAPSLLVVTGYGLAFFLMAQVVLQIPVGIAYAIWSGLGTALVAVLGYFIYHDALSREAILGIGLIVAGVLLINLSGNRPVEQ